MRNLENSVGSCNGLFDGLDSYVIQRTELGRAMVNLMD